MSTREPNRRQFLQATAAAVAFGATAQRATAGDEPANGVFRFGLVTDVHYADRDIVGTRHYRDSQEKLRKAIEVFRREKVSFVAELGDFIDAGTDKQQTITYLHTIREVLGEFPGPRHYVLGNHCLDRMTKQEFLAECGAEIQQSHYSFDAGGRHFVVLDADFKQDGTPYADGDYSWTDTWVPEPQQRWLADDLARAAGRQTIVFAHQNLDKEEDPHGVRNAPEVRRVLEAAGNVLAVFQGHMHSGGYRNLAGIHYCTLPAMVEGRGPKNNGYGIVTLWHDSYDWQWFKA